MAAATYGTLKAKLDGIAAQAGSLEALLARVAALRTRPAQQSVIMVTAQNGVPARPIRTECCVYRSWNLRQAS